MSNDSIWTGSNIIFFIMSCGILIILIAFLIHRFNEKLRNKKHLKMISNINVSLIRKHQKEHQISEVSEKIWVELSNLCFSLLDDYCRDEKEVIWIMNAKVWPIIDYMAYQDQKKAIAELKAFGGSMESNIFPFEKEEWHKSYIKSKNL